MLHCPPYLKPGDKIAIISTARKISREEIQPAVDVLTSWGLEVVIGETIGAEQDQYAGPDLLRRSEFQYYLDQPDIKAILMGRGGYGTVRILDKINFQAFVDNPKWLIGYSDYTYLFNLVNQFYGIQTLHATMPINFPTNTPEAIQSIHDALFGKSLTYTFEAEVVHPVHEIQGQLAGGNLSILYALMGTPNGLNFDHQILVIEDIGEYLYHIDRMMMALKTGNKLNALKALVVGGMTSMTDNLIPFGKTPREIILEHCAGYGYPIIFDAPVGHFENNKAFKLGADARISISGSEVTIDQPA